MKTLNRIIGMAYLESRWLIRQPLWLVQSALFMLGLFVIMSVWGGRLGVLNYLCGAIVSTMWSLGINIIGQAMGWSKIMKTIDMFIASGIHPLHYVLGLFIASVPFSLTNTVFIYIPIAIAFNMLNTVIVALMIGFVLLLISMLLGIAIAMSIKNPRNISAITNPIASILVFLPPVYYPAIALPEPIRYIALATPTASCAEIVRSLAGLSTLFEPAILSLIAWLVIGIVLVCKTMKWGLS